MSERYPGGYITKSPPTPTATAAPGVWTLDQAMQNVKGGTWPPNGPFWVENVFSTYLYDGTGTDQTITNSINLSLYGGLVWIKQRNSTGSHALWDTVANTQLASNTTAAGSGGTNFTSTSSGVTINSGNSALNGSGSIYGMWTFRKQAKFFDVVTYTGNGTSQAINHNLGSVPGCIIVKRTNNTGNWQVYHRSLGNTKSLFLNLTEAEDVWTAYWNDTSPTSTQFTVGSSGGGNNSGDSYVAYLFAHDAGGFGASGTDNVISCGSYTGDGNTPGPTVTLGWEPQWLMIKKSSAAGTSWQIIDNMRGFSDPDNGREWLLQANSSSAEGNNNVVGVTATGFYLYGANSEFNNSGDTYIYIAIRRGPMRTPTDATKVFTPTVYTGTNVDNRLVNTTIAPDMVWIRQRDSTTVGGMVVGDRLRGQPYLLTGTTGAEVNDADSFDAQLISAVEYGTAFASMNGVWVGNDATSQLNASTTASNQIAEAFKRAPGFFDIVCYTGTGANRTVSHNLGAAPELILVKNRDNASTYNWNCYHSALGNTKRIYLNTSAAAATDSTAWNNTTPTSSVFTVGTDSTVNFNGMTYVAYLFATCPGVSKVGSYTGNGTTQTINCGFTSSARFILIKRTDTTGNWYVFDSARGIVTGVNDPYIGLNLTSAEATDDCVGTNSSGFTVTDSTPTFINVNNATYIFLAIA